MESPGMDEKNTYSSCWIPGYLRLSPLISLYFNPYSLFRVSPLGFLTEFIGLIKESFAGDLIN